MRGWISTLVLILGLAARAHAQCNPVQPDITPRAGLTRPIPGQCQVVEALDTTIDRLDDILCGAGLTCDIGANSITTPTVLSNSLCDDTNNILKKVSGAWQCRPDSGTGGGGGVETFNGRPPVSGNIVPTTGDYQLGQIGGVNGARGNTGTIQMVTGTTPQDTCATWDTFGNLKSTGVECGSGSGGAPGASYITQKAEDLLTGEQSLGSLGSGGTTSLLLNSITSGPPAVGTLVNYGGSGSSCALPQVVYHINADGTVLCTTPTGTGVTDHGLLTGLGDDDHAQYLLRTGRATPNNDAVISTSDDGTLTGSNGTGGLVLKGNASASGSKPVSINPHWTSASGTLPTPFLVSPSYTSSVSTAFARFANDAAGNRSIVTTTANGIEVDGLVISPAVTPSGSATGLVLNGIAVGVQTRPADGTSPTWQDVSAISDYGDLSRAGTTGNATITNWNSLYVNRSAVAGTTINTARGLYYYIGGSSAITSDFAVDVANINNSASGLGAAVRAQYGDGTGRWAFLSTGTAKSFLRGGLRLGGSSTPTTASVTQQLEVLGNIYLDNTASSGELRIREPNAGAYYTGFLAGDITAGSNLMYVLPTAAPTANQVLTSSAPTAGVATLSWTSGAGGGAPSTGHYVVTTNDGLANQTNLGTTPFTTGLLLNTVSGGTGTLTTYAGTDCGAGNAIRALGANGAYSTCIAVSGGVVGFDVADSGTYKISGEPNIFRWDANDKGVLTLGVQNQGSMSLAQQQTAMVRFAGNVDQYSAMLTRTGGLRAGFEGSNTPYLPRNTWVETSEYYSPVPPNLRYYRVTSAGGKTAASQPIGYGNMWSPYLPLQNGAWVYNAGATNYAYEVTGATGACSAFSCKCTDSGPGSGTCCRTGATYPTFPTSPGTSVTDGSCTLTARDYNTAAITTITDGSVTLMRDPNYLAYMQGVPRVSINPTANFDRIGFDVQVNDNDSGAAFALTRQENLTEPSTVAAYKSHSNPQRNFDGSTQFVKWAISDGDARVDQPRELINSGYGTTAFQVQGYDTVPAPVVPPTVALAGGSGGHLTSTEICFSYQWESVQTSGRGVLSPETCVVPNGQNVTVSVSGFTWPTTLLGAALRAVVFERGAGSGRPRIGWLKDSAATLSLYDVEACEGGANYGHRCYQDAECPSSVCFGIAETEHAKGINFGGPETFSVRGGDGYVRTWTASTTLDLATLMGSTFFKPTIQDGYRYMPVLWNCSACSGGYGTACDRNPAATMLTAPAGSEPAWGLTPGAFTCEGPNANTKYNVWRNIGPDSILTVAPGIYAEDLVQFKEASASPWRTASGVDRLGRFYVNRKSLATWSQNPALRLSGDQTGGGKIEIGNGGSTAPDVILSRVSAGILRLGTTGGDFLSFSSGTGGGGSLGLGLSGSFDLSIGRTAANTLAIATTTATFPTVAFRNSNSVDSFSFDLGGPQGARMQFGDGTLAPDVNLYRGGANALATDDAFYVNGAGAELRLKGTGSGYYSSFRAGAQPSSNLIYTLPIDTPATGECLKVLSGGTTSSLEWGGCGTGGGALEYDANNDGTLESTALTRLVCDGIGLACDEPVDNRARIKLNPHGTGSAVQMFGGGTANPNTCAQFTDGGSIISTGVACGSGGGSNGWVLSPPYTDTASNVRIISPIYPSNPLTVYQSQDDYQANVRALTLTRVGALELGGTPRVERGQSVQVGEFYSPDPAFKCGFKVTQAGTTAATFRPLEWPIIRHSKQPLAIGQRVLRDTLCQGFYYYTVTSIQGGGTCAAECSNAGTACSSNDTCTNCGATGFGCQCTTGTTKPTADCFDGGSDGLNPGPNGCTFTDGTCNFTATTYPNDLSITDGNAIFQNNTAGYGAFHHAPVIETRSDIGGEPGNATQILTGDNGTYQFMLGELHGYKLSRGNPAFGTLWHLIAGPGFYGDYPGPEPVFALVGSRGPTFSARFPLTRGPVGQDAALSQFSVGDYIGLAPQAGPIVTLTSGGNLTQGGRYCFSQAWQNRSTGGITAHGPETCVYPTATLKSLTITPNPVSWTYAPYSWEPLVIFYWGVNYVATAANFSDTITLTDGLSLSAPRGFTESQYNDPFSLSNDPFVEIGSVRAEGLTRWQTGLTLAPRSGGIVPTSPWSTIPPTPFAYHVTGTHCDANCQNCYTNSGGGAGEVTAGAEPPWRVDAGLFCDTQAPGSRIQYQRSYWYKNGVNIAATTDSNPQTARSYDADSSDLLIYRSNVDGESPLFRSYLGRPQYVCNSETKPTCDASKRGLVWYTCNTGLNPDVEERCTRTGQGTYEWRAANGGTTCSKATVGYAALTGASTTETEQLFTLPANAKMLGTTIKHTQAFAGTSLTSMTVSVGSFGDATYYSPAFNVFQSPGDAFYLDSGPQYKSATSLAHTVYAHFTANGAMNAMGLTAGSVDIRYCYVTFP